MECGVHGARGRLVVRRVAVVPRQGNDAAITQNPLTMVHTALVVDCRCKTAMPQSPVHVS